MKEQREREKGAAKKSGGCFVASGVGESSNRGHDLPSEGRMGDKKGDKGS